MNIEDIKKKVEDYKAELIKSRECCDVVDLSDEVLCLLSIIESLEADLSIIANSENVSSMNSIAEDALKAIRGN